MNRAPTPKMLKAVRTKKLIPMEVDPTNLESAMTDIPVEINKKIMDYKKFMEVFKNY